MTDPGRDSGTDPRPSNELAPTDDPAEIEARLRMPLVDAMLSQRAVRRLRPDPVDDAVVLRCIELALKAPTSPTCPRPTW